MSTSITRGNVLKMFAVGVTFDPASVATITTAEQTVTVPGVQVGDIVLAVNKPSNTAGLGIVNARVSAANTIALTLMNTTAGSVDAGSERYVFVIARGEQPSASLPGIFNA